MKKGFPFALMSLLSLIVLAGGKNSFAQPSGTPIPGIQSLAGIDPTLPNDELKVLDSTVAGAEFVAVGETVHGSGGFVSMEHRISKYLIEEKGFRLVMIENPILRSKGMSDWLASCAAGTPGDPPIQDLYQPIIQDLTFFNWLCSFNQAHPHDPVRYRGMDIWDRPWEWQAAMERVNQKLNLGLDLLLQTTSAHCAFHHDQNWDNLTAFEAALQKDKKIPDADYLPCTQSLDALRLILQNLLLMPQYLQNHSDLLDFMEAVDSAEGWQGNFDLAYQNVTEQWWACRDQAQAKNEYHIWQQEGFPKAIILTHTSHAAKDESPSDWWKMGLGEIHSGISYLRQMDDLKDHVKTIALTGYRVTGVQGDFLSPTSPESLDLRLHTLGYSVAYIDSNAPYILAQNRWWIENENSTDGYPDGVYMVLRDNFDALFFVDQSLEGTPIPTWYSVWYW